MTRIDPYTASAEYAIRAVVPDDLEALLALCAEHARYERAAAVAENVPALRTRLSSLLFAESPRLWAWIAESGTDILGYASASAEVSTWHGSEYLHLDCLYLRPEHRGRGIGQALLHTAIEHARRSGHAQLQWQTPEWNLDGARFYRRSGAQESIKRRYTLDVGAVQSAD